MKAVVFVDVQNDFVKGGKLPYGYPEADLVPQIIEFAKKCRSEGAALYATVDTHQTTVYDNYPVSADAATPNPKPIAGYLTTLEGQLLPIEHCIEGTNGHQIVEGLIKDENQFIIIPQAHVIDKPTFGSYALVDKLLKFKKEYREELSEIVLVGFDLGICVLANAVLLRAKFPDLKISVRTDLCGCVNEDTFKAACEVLKLQQITLSA